jgi:hypothetical protein
MKTRECPVCEGVLSRSARRCPHCGHYIWSTGRKIVAAIILFPFVIFVLSLILTQIRK